MSNKFRFGVVSERMSTAREWLAQVRSIEDMGYSTVLLRDHFIYEPFGDQFAPLTALMAAANATRTLRIGTLVIDNDYRHPVVLAKEAATLDLLSEGRFELGLGAGWLAEEYEQAGMSFDQPGIRVSRLTEALHVLKGLFATEPLTFSGNHYTITNMRGFPQPTQRPHPPILIAGMGQRMLSLAAREADIIGFQTPDDPAGRSSAAITQKIAWIRQAAGERFHEIELSALITPLITQDHKQGAADFAHMRGWHNLSVEQVLDMPTTFTGSLERICDEMYARRERFGFSYYMVTDRQMEVFAPIVARLTGQ